MWRQESTGTGRHLVGNVVGIYEGITYEVIAVLFRSNSTKVTVFAQELQTLQILIERLTRLLTACSQQMPNKHLVLWFYIQFL